MFPCFGSKVLAFFSGHTSASKLTNLTIAPCYEDLSDHKQLKFCFLKKNHDYCGVPGTGWRHL
jgi:hypothetical protein